MRDRDEVPPDIEHELALESHDAPHDHQGGDLWKLESAKYGAKRRLGETAAAEGAQTSTAAQRQRVQASAREQLVATIMEQASRIVLLYNKADWREAALVTQVTAPDDDRSEESEFALLPFCSMKVETVSWDGELDRLSTSTEYGWVRSDGKLIFGAPRLIEEYPKSLRRFCEGLTVRQLRVLLWRFRVIRVRKIYRFRPLRW